MSCNKINIFYTYSWRNNDAKIFCDSLTKKLINMNNVCILDRSEDDENPNNFGGLPLDRIDEAHIIIIDITPDETDSGLRFNEHTMIEYGYASKTHPNENILLLYHNNLSTSDLIGLPMFLSAKHWFPYEVSDVYGVNEYITEMITNYKSSDYIKNIEHIKQIELNNKELHKQLETQFYKIPRVAYDIKEKLRLATQFNNINDIHNIILLYIDNYEYIQCDSDENNLRNMYHAIKLININNYELNNLYNGSKLQTIQDSKLYNDTQFDFAMMKLKLIPDMKSINMTKKDYDDIKTVVNYNTTKTIIDLILEYQRDSDKQVNKSSTCIIL